MLSLSSFFRRVLYTTKEKELKRNIGEEPSISTYEVETKSGLRLLQSEEKQSC